MTGSTARLLRGRHISSCPPCAPPRPVKQDPASNGFGPPGQARRPKATFSRDNTPGRSNLAADSFALRTWIAGGVRDPRLPRDTPSDLCAARSGRRAMRRSRGYRRAGASGRRRSRSLGLRRRIIRMRRRSADGSAMVAWRSSPLIGRFGPFPIYVAFVEDLPPMPPTPQGGSPRCAR